MDLSDTQVSVLREIEIYPMISGKEFKARTEISEPTFTRTKAKLIEIGIIDGDSLKIRYEKIRQFDKSYVFFKVKGQEESHIDAAIEHLSKFEFVYQVAKIGGTWDVLAKVIQFSTRDRMLKVQKLLSEIYFVDHLTLDKDDTCYRKKGLLDILT